MTLGMTQLSRCRQRATMTDVPLGAPSRPMLPVMTCNVLTLNLELALLRTERCGRSTVTRKTLPCPSLLLEKFLPMVWPVSPSLSLISRCPLCTSPRKLSDDRGLLPWHPCRLPIVACTKPITSILGTLIGHRKSTKTFLCVWLLGGTVSRLPLQNAIELVAIAHVGRFESMPSNASPFVLPGFTTVRILLGPIARPNFPNTLPFVTEVRRPPTLSTLAHRTPHTAHQHAPRPNLEYTHDLARKYYRVE